MYPGIEDRIRFLETDDSVPVVTEVPDSTCPPVGTHPYCTCGGCQLTRNVLVVIAMLSLVFCYVYDVRLVI